jgi:hypothetical protein
MPLRGWRCFPWDPAATTGAPGSPEFVPPGQTGGRFDLHDTPPVRYLAGTPEHAVAEVIQAFRGTTLAAHHLVRGGRPLALVPVTVSDPLSLADLDDPAVLTALGTRPSVVAHRDRSVTQGVARAVHAAGHHGLRWWSAFGGQWDSSAIFLDRVTERRFRWGTPDPLTLAHPAVIDAATELRIRR